MVRWQIMRSQFNSFRQYTFGVDMNSNCFFSPRRRRKTKKEEGAYVVSEHWTRYTHTLNRKIDWFPCGTCMNSGEDRTYISIKHHSSARQWFIFSSRFIAMRVKLILKLLSWKRTTTITTPPPPAAASQLFSLATQIWLIMLCSIRSSSFVIVVVFCLPGLPYSNKNMSKYVHYTSQPIIYHNSCLIQPSKLWEREKSLEARFSLAFPPTLFIHVGYSFSANKTSHPRRNKAIFRTMKMAWDVSSISQ